MLPLLFSNYIPITCCSSLPTPLTLPYRLDTHLTRTSRYTRSACLTEVSMRVIADASMSKLTCTGERGGRSGDEDEDIHIMLSMSSTLSTQKGVLG